MHVQRSFGEIALLLAALALLALALAGALGGAGTAHAVAYPIAGRMMTAAPDETLRGNSRSDNALLYAEVPVTGLEIETVRAWLVQETVAAAEPPAPDCMNELRFCLRQTRLDAELRIFYRLPPETAATADTQKLEAALRAWFATRLKPAGKAR